MWHLENDDNYVLTLLDIDQENEGKINTMSDKVTCARYEEKGKVLVAGTKDGRVLFWKNIAGIYYFKIKLI
jgi:intraflagellar transport protein 140